MNKQHFYVYCVSVDNIIVYIGKGTKSRYKHPTSGRSSVLEFNRMYFTGEVDKIKTEVFQWFFSDKEAVEAETKFIDLFKPIYNQIDSERKSVNVKEIEKHKTERIYSTNRISTKPNFKKLCREYTILQDKMNANRTQQEYDYYKKACDEIINRSDDLSRYLSVLSYDRLTANGYNKQRLEKEYSSQLFLKNNDLTKYLSLEVNKSYSLDDLKCRIQSFYDVNGVDKKAKTNDLDIFYEFKNTKLTGNISAIKILGVK